MNDPVNHPDHYCSHPSGIECIQITEHMNFNIGNAVKYIWRFSGPGPGMQPDMEDLHKAMWYLKREIARRSAKKQRIDHRSLLVTEEEMKTNLI